MVSSRVLIRYNLNVEPDIFPESDLKEIKRIDQIKEYAH